MNISSLRRGRIARTPENLIRLYYVLFASCAVLYLLIGMLSQGKSFHYSFFFAPLGQGATSTDLFMDFFNSVRDASHNGGYDKKVIYPPLASLIYYLLGKMMNADLVGQPFDKRFNLRNNDPTALLIYFVCTALCMFLIFLVVDRYLLRNHFRVSPALMALTCTFSFPVLYAVQRGNIIIFVIPLTMFFIFFRNDENKIIRELSYIALAIAAGIKLYPAIFGVLLLTDKKYKQAARLVLYGIAAFVLPVFFFGGPELLWQLVQNILSFDKNRAIADVELFRNTYSFTELLTLYVPSNFPNFLGKMMFYMLEILAVLMVFILPKDWQKVTALCYLIFNVRSLSAMYALTFFLVPFLMFVVERKRFRWTDLLYLLCMVLMFMPLPCVWYGFLDGMAAGSELLNGLVEPAYSLTKTKIIMHYAAVNKLVSVVAFQGVFLLMMFISLRDPAPKKAGKTETPRLVT